MELYLKTWTEVEAYLKTNDQLILPVGSTEQHGPTGLIGTDFLNAWEIAKEVGKSTNTMVAPPVCYGMALHHMAFAGSAAHKPSVYIQLIKDVCTSFFRHGFKKIAIINGHGGNIPSLNAAFSEILDQDQTLHFKLFNWWHLSKVRAYEETHFGEKNGFHATCGEISVTMFTHPDGFKKPRSLEYFENAKSHPWPLSPAQFREHFPDGRMGSDPRLATQAHGKVLFKLAADEISEQLNSWH
jgi:creatinine amidohydrolase